MHGLAHQPSPTPSMQLGQPRAFGLLSSCESVPSWICKSTSFSLLPSCAVLPWNTIQTCLSRSNTSLSKGQHSTRPRDPAQSVSLVGPAFPSRLLPFRSLSTTSSRLTSTHARSLGLIAIRPSAFTLTQLAVFFRPDFQLSPSLSHQDCRSAHGTSCVKPAQPWHARRS